MLAELCDGLANALTKFKALVAGLLAGGGSDLTQMPATLLRPAEPQSLSDWIF